MLKRGVAGPGAHHLMCHHMVRMSRLLTPPRAAALATAVLATVLPAAAWLTAGPAGAATGRAAVPGAPGSGAAAAPERRCTLPGGMAELSGLAMSRKHPGIFYAVNDSGNTNQVFAVDCTGPAGQLKATYTLSGVGNTDWEALAIGKDAAGL